MSTRYEFSYILKIAERDDFERGCDGPSMENFIDVRESAATVRELLEKFYAFVPFRVDTRDAVEFDACEDTGRVDVYGTETANGDEPTEREREQWEAGKLALYYVTYSIQVQKVTRESVSVSATLAKEV